MYGQCTDILWQLEKTKGTWKMIKNENYYTIFGWMLRELNLSGVDLVVYAIIYPFRKTGRAN